ncbi:MAG: hypothetical protein LIO69_00190 [Oscillospiraceae bacterium]|nr:hypothetical protein [Oscillospiraceae bacterium]
MENIREKLSALRKSSLFKPIVIIVVLIALRLITGVLSEFAEIRQGQIESSTVISNSDDSKTSEKTQELTTGDRIVEMLGRFHIGVAHIVVLVVLTLVLGYTQYHQDHKEKLKEDNNDD